MTTTAAPIAAMPTMIPISHGLKPEFCAASLTGFGVLIESVATVGAAADVLADVAA